MILIPERLYLFLKYVLKFIFNLIVTQTNYLDISALEFHGFMPNSKVEVKIWLLIEFKK